MRLCFTIDDVLRAKTIQFGKIYKKYINPEIDLATLDFSTNNYAQIFGFESKKEYNKFLYEDYAFEIFAEAGTCEKTVDKKLNLWLLDLQNNADLQEPVETLWANPMEFNASIGFTYFFLSKMATRIREVFLPADSSLIWTKCDVLVTADPKLLPGRGRSTGNPAGKGAGQTPQQELHLPLDAGPGHL